MAEKVRAAEHLAAHDLCHIVDPDSSVAMCGYNVVARTKHPLIREGTRCATCKRPSCPSCHRMNDTSRAPAELVAP